MENGEAAGADVCEAASKGEAFVDLGTASKPNPSDGSAIWNGPSILRRSGNFTDLPESPCRESSETVNGESCFAAAVNGLATGADSAA